MNPIPAFLRSLNHFSNRHFSQCNDIELPPPLLRERVHGTMDVRSFIKVGRNCVRDLTLVLQKNGKNWREFPMVLDFGCGCGRILRHLKEFSHLSRFYGIDMDREAIEWCQKKMGFAQFNTNNPLPPLNLPHKTFDLIFAVSVFTHLDEKDQFAWLTELHRIAKEKALILITTEGSLIPTIGNYCGQSLSRQEIELLKNNGIFSKKPAPESYFSSYASYCHSYHTKEYIFANWPRYFNITDFIRRGLNNHHDITVLEKI